MKQRFDREVTPNQAAELWSATYILMGVRYEHALIQTLLQGVFAMKVSVTYQAILREGEAKEARKVFLLLGRDHSGDPSAEVQAALDALCDVNRLEELTPHSAIAPEPFPGNYLHKESVTRTAARSAPCRS
jgi:hypothetical protein